jgi:hypothetical protein
MAPMLLLLLALITHLQSTIAYSQEPTTVPQDTAKLELNAKRLQLEIEKLELENAKLKLEAEQLPWLRGWLPAPWIAPAVALAGVLVSAVVSILVAWLTARRTRWGTFDLALVEQRLERYPELVAAAEFLALYFPQNMVSKEECKQAGNKLRTSYLGGTGILLSKQARDKYFMLADTLTRASKAQKLNVPKIEDYPEWISQSKIKQYSKKLHVYQPKATHVRTWEFGKIPQKMSDKAVDQAAEKFRDFVLLQVLASRLRTELTKDLGGRRRPR